MDANEIRRWHSVFKRDDELVEIRILGRFQYSGYFKSIDTLLNAIEPYLQMDDEQCYFTLNTINDACYGRQQCEKFVKSPKATTTDNDITRRKWLLLDFDPKRAAGVNASEAEFELAHKKAQEVFAYLRKQGFADPVICISGNGWHLLYRIDLPNTSDITATVKDFLKSLSVMFSDDKVDIDEKVFNAGRICKLYGTTAKKGANLPDRPWRESKIVYVPKEISNVPLEKIQQVANLLPKEEPKQKVLNRNFRNQLSTNMSFDLRTWLNEYGIVYKEESQGDGTKFVLEHCPWEDTHSNKQKWDSALFQNSSGQITFSCFHSHCKDKTWFDFRTFYEPEAYSKPHYYQQFNKPFSSIIQQKHKYQIKEENEELGKKWLSLSDISNVDLTKIEKVKTGFDELDRNILGLNMTEVTLLSGSNSSGKSSWLNSLLLNIVQQGYKFALWSGELPPQILKAWIQMVAAGKRFLRPSNYCDGKYYVPNNIGEKIDNWLDGNLFLFNNDYGCVFEEIKHDMSELIKLGVKVFALDNLMSLDIDLLEGDKNGKQRELMLQIKEFAKKNNVHIILVAHPRKTIAFLRKTDISGSSDITNIVDNCFIIHRVNNDFFKTGAEFFGQSEIQKYQGFGNVLEVCKNRMWGVVDLLVGMHYEIESRRFKNTIDEDIHYGWEEQPQQSTLDYTQQEPTMPFEINNGEEAPF